MRGHTELFDEALDRRIWSLADTRMQWLKRIADTRRKRPEEVATELAEMIEEHQVFENHTPSDVQMRELVASENWTCKGLTFETILFPQLTFTSEAYTQELTALVDELDQVRNQ
jgi:hypothetical protein